MYEKREKEMDKAFGGLLLELWLVDKHFGHNQSTS